MFVAEEFVGGENEVSFERCGFDRNQATEVGAALGVASYHFFDGKEERTAVSITNW